MTDKKKPIVAVNESEKANDRDWNKACRNQTEQTGCTYFFGERTQLENNNVQHRFQ